MLGFLAIFILTLCSGCLQTGYSQPTYVISDGEEEQQASEKL